MADPDKIVKFDGALTMDETRQGCVIEQNAGYQLQKIERTTISDGGVVLMVNKAEFVANLDFLPELLFIDPGPNNPQAIKDQKHSQGWTFLCSGPIFVQGNIQNVMVFAK